MKRPALRACCLAFLLAAVLCARAEESSPAAAARAFYEAYASGDERAVAAMWAPSAPEALRRRTAWTMHTRCMRLLAFRSVDGGYGVVSIDALLMRQSFEGPQSVEPHLATLTLARANGGWRVAGWTMQEESVADAIAAAPDDRARNAIADMSRAAVTPLLDRLLAQRALARVNAGDDAGAAALASFMKRLARENGDVAGESLAYSIECIVLRHDRTTLAASVEAGRTSLALAQQSGDPDALAKALLRLGRAEGRHEPSQENESRFEQVLALADQLEDPLPLGTAASRLAALRAARGDHRRALSYAVMARDFAERNGDPLTLVAAEMNLAGEYRFDGDFELAAHHYRTALDAAHRTGYHGDDAAIKTVLASLEHNLGHEAAFRKLRAEVLQEVDPVADSETLVQLHGNDVQYALAHGRLDEAERAAHRMLAAAWRKSDVFYAWQTLAHVHVRQHQPHAVFRDLQHVVQTGDVDPGVATDRAEALRQLGHIDEATASLREAVQAAEATRVSIVADERQRRLTMQNQVGIYRALVDLLLAQKNDAEALQVAEQTKARALLDLLGGEIARLPTMSDDERRTEAELARAAAVRVQDARSRTELERRRDARDAFRAQMRAKYPTAVASQTVPLTPAEINALLPDRQTAFLELMQSESQLHLFLIRRGAHAPRIRVHSMAIPDALVRRLEKALASGDPRYVSPARELYARLLAPFESELRGVTTLGVVPDGALWRVPFEALIDAEHRFVASRFATFYAPSLAVYAAMRRTTPARREDRSLLAFANPAGDATLPPLPDAQREVTAAAAVCSRARVYVGRDALESRAKRESGGFAVIHFATHGVIDDANAMYSQLRLTRGGNDDGVLEAWELMRLDLHSSQLVVLSACDTARGHVGAGEGLIGMTWALFAAGCPATIATQWKVDSASAADLMIAFYRDWQRTAPQARFAKAHALQRARAELLRDPRRQHPFFWASHVLIGE